MLEGYSWIVNCPNCVVNFIGLDVSEFNDRDFPACAILIIIIRGICFAKDAPC